MDAADAAEGASLDAGRADDRLRWSDPNMPAFAQVLINVLLVSVVNYTVWFAITFYTFLQTGSVFATGVIAGVFMLASVSTGIWFGSLVDHYDKVRVMQASALVSTVLYSLALAVYLSAPQGAFAQVSSVRLWLLVALLMVGVIVGNLRNIALPTMVTAIVPAAKRARANGLVGTTSGISFLVTSVISGLLVGWNGMLGVLLGAIAALLVSLVHLQFVRLPRVGGDLTAAATTGTRPGKIDLRGTIAVVRAIPGMPALIVFAALNNLLAGTFLALLDAYGLSMVSVQAWGLIFGATSTLMIVGGILIARTGLTSNPVRLILLVNLGMWAVTVVFPMRESIFWLAAGIAGYMMLTPYAEAAEQTVLQKIVPYERQGRVFGFAQSIEQAAAPLTAFLMGPLTQFVFIPFMTDGWGAKTMGPWFGTGAARGMALVFVLTGVVGLIVTAYALGSRFYRQLRDTYLSSEAT